MLPQHPHLWAGFTQNGESVCAYKGPYQEILYQIHTWTKNMGNKSETSFTNQVHAVYLNSAEKRIWRTEWMLHRIGDKNTESDAWPQL